MSDLEPLKPRQRRKRTDVIAISTPTRTVELYEDQYFCETYKAWELWQEIDGLPRMVKRFRVRSYLWIHCK